MLGTAYLSHVSWRVGVLSPEYGTNTVHPLPATRNLHLLVELRALRQVRVLSKVREAENVGTTLGRRTNETRWLEAVEVILLRIFDE